jgi:hypothetical protein
MSADSVEKLDFARATFLPERVDDRVPGLELWVVFYLPLFF